MYMFQWLFMTHGSRVLNREFKIYDATAKNDGPNFAYLMKQNKRFARPSRAFFISVHFFPVLGKSAT